MRKLILVILAISLISNIYMGIALNNSTLPPLPSSVSEAVAEFPIVEAVGWQIEEKMNSRLGQTTVWADDLFDLRAVIYGPRPDVGPDYFLHEVLHLVVRTACVGQGTVIEESVVVDLANAISRGRDPLTGLQRSVQSSVTTP